MGFIKNIVRKVYYRFNIFRRFLLWAFGNRIHSNFHSDSLIFRSKVYANSVTNVISIGRNSSGGGVTINVKGMNNQIIIGDRVHFGIPVHFEVTGNNNKIIIGNHTSFNPDAFKNRMAIFRVLGNACVINVEENCNLQANLFSACDTGSTILLGKNAILGDDTKVISMEGKGVSIGKNFLCSYYVEIRNSDSHSIFDQSGRRINFAKDIFIGDNVWVSQDVLILKGAYIPSGSIIGARSLVNKQFTNEGSVFVGSPAKEIKNCIIWDMDRKESMLREE